MGDIASLENEKDDPNWAHVRQDTSPREVSRLNLPVDASDDGIQSERRVELVVLAPYLSTMPGTVMRFLEGIVY